MLRVRVSDGVCGPPALLCRAEEAQSAGALPGSAGTSHPVPDLPASIGRAGSRGTEPPHPPGLPPGLEHRADLHTEKLQGEGLGAAPAFRVVRESKASILVLEKVAVVI